MRNKPARCQLENKGKNSPKTINREIYSLLPDVEVIAENYSTLIRMQEKHVSKKKEQEALKRKFIEAENNRIR